MSLEDRAREVAEWHAKAFPWAGVRDVALILRGEAQELVDAPDVKNLRDELADCAIAIFAAAAIAEQRHGIKLEAAITDKLREVMMKHPAK